jgi:acetyl esterase/lipase
LAVVQSGAGAPGFRLGLGFAALASAGLAVLRGRARGTGPVLERALDGGLGPGWRDDVEAELGARLRRRPSLIRVLVAPISGRRRSVERIANIRYGPAGRGNLLDLYRDRSDRSGRPVLVYLHGGAFRFGSKRLGARHLLYRLAGRGWLCVSANYSLINTAGLADPPADVQRVIAWVGEHGPEYGADPKAVFIAGSSAGGHLASLAALSPNDLAGVISLYGYYGPVALDGPPPPPWFVAHGDQDTLVVVDDARAFVEELRAASPNPVVYAELPGAQHGFDLFRSRRFDTVVDAIEAFAGWVTHERSSLTPRRRSPPRASCEEHEAACASSSASTSSSRPSTASGPARAAHG